MQGSRHPGSLSTSNHTVWTPASNSLCCFLFFQLFICFHVLARAQRKTTFIPVGTNATVFWWVFMLPVSNCPNCTYLKEYHIWYATLIMPLPLLCLKFFRVSPPLVAGGTWAYTVISPQILPVAPVLTFSSCHPEAATIPRRSCLTTMSLVRWYSTLPDQISATLPSSYHSLLPLASVPSSQQHEKSSTGALTASWKSLTNHVPYPQVIHCILWFLFGLVKSRDFCMLNIRI